MSLGDRFSAGQLVRRNRERWPGRISPNNPALNIAPGTIVRIAAIENVRDDFYFVTLTEYQNIIQNPDYYLDYRCGQTDRPPLFAYYCFDPISDEQAAIVRQILINAGVPA